MNTSNDFEKKVRAMRKAQKLYFLRQNQTNLAEAKQTERVVDMELKKLDTERKEIKAMTQLNFDQVQRQEP
jgi:hypothetical protein